MDEFRINITRFEGHMHNALLLVVWFGLVAHRSVISRKITAEKGKENKGIASK